MEHTLKWSLQRVVLSIILLLAERNNKMTLWRRELIMCCLILKSLNVHARNTFASFKWSIIKGKILEIRYIKDIISGRCTCDNSLMDWLCNKKLLPHLHWIEILEK